MPDISKKEGKKSKYNKNKVKGIEEVGEKKKQKCTIVTDARISNFTNKNNGGGGE
jgi:hypothetical protein